MAVIGMQLWQNFDEECTRAQKMRDQAIAEARRDRDAIFNKGRWTAPARVEAVLEARFEARKTEAEKACEETCKQAEGKLLTDLTKEEEEHRGMRRPG
jgi:vacuolar-type H+-ATPase subunit H